MRFRPASRWSARTALTTLTAALAAVAPAAADPAPAAAAPSGRAARSLPACPTGTASSRPPTGPAGPGAPRACRAPEPRTVVAGGWSTRRPADRRTQSTPSGYHHLGAGTGGEWSGVSGRISVVNTSVRRGTYDFVASRFMVKQDIGHGDIAWLEAGWAETGWTGRGRQQIYTFNTNTRTWKFYDQYVLRPGNRIWLDLHTDGGGWWQAWLWWNNRWNLLASPWLPIGTGAYVEQYVEVHVDGGRSARMTVPPVTVDNVRLRSANRIGARYWRDDVATLTADPARQRAAGFCLNWVTRFDTWTAGDCPRG